MELIWIWKYVKSKSKLSYYLFLDVLAIRGLWICLCKPQDTINIKQRKMPDHLLQIPTGRPAKASLKWKPERGLKMRVWPAKMWRKTTLEDSIEMNLTPDQACDKARDWLHRTQWFRRSRRNKINKNIYENSLRFMLLF